MRGLDDDGPCFLVAVVVAEWQHRSRMQHCVFTGLSFLDCGCLAAAVCVVSGGDGVVTLNQYFMYCVTTGSRAPCGMIVIITLFGSFFSNFMRTIDWFRGFRDVGARTKHPLDVVQCVRRRLFASCKHPSSHALWTPRQETLLLYGGQMRSEDDLPP